MTKYEMMRRLNSMSPQLIELGRRMIHEGHSAAYIALNSCITMKQANALVADKRTGTDAVAPQLPAPNWIGIMTPSPPFGDRALLLMVADECDVTNPDGSAIPLSAALVAQIRAAVGQKID